MNKVSAKYREQFFMRTLLLHRCGPTSFEDLRTIDGVIYPTYHQACRALNLLNDHTIWKVTLAEARAFTMPRQMRYIFAYVLANNNISDPTTLWNIFKEDLAEDFLRRNSDHVAYNLALNHNSQILQDSGENICETFFVIVYICKYIVWHLWIQLKRLKV